MGQHIQLGYIRIALASSECSGEPAHACRLAREFASYTKYQRRARLDILPCSIRQNGLPVKFFIAFLSSADFFKIIFFDKFFQEYHPRVANSLYPDQARHFVGPDLVPNYLQMLTVDDICRHN